MAHLRHQHRHQTIIVACAPTKLADDPAKYIFYDHMHTAIQSVSTHDNLNHPRWHEHCHWHVLHWFWDSNWQYGAVTPNDNTLCLLISWAANNLPIVDSWNKCHSLVATIMSVRFYRPQNRRVNNEVLLERNDLTQAYKTELQNRFKAFADLQDDTEAAWNMLSSTIMKSAVKNHWT